VGQCDHDTLNGARQVGATVGGVVKTGGRQPIGEQEMGTAGWTSWVMEPIRQVVRDMIG